MTAVKYASFPGGERLIQLLAHSFLTVLIRLPKKFPFVVVIL